MKTITLKVTAFCLFFLSFTSKAVTLPTPVITINPTAIVLDQSNTWTFDFSGSYLTGSENLVIYFWQPTSHASVPLTYLGSLKWSFTFTPTTFFGQTVAQIAGNANQFYFNIQDGVGGVSGTLHKTFTTPVTTLVPVSINGTPTGTYALDQDVTWIFDLTGSGFTAGQDLYMWAWSPANPDAPNYNNSSAFSKLTYVSGMTWSKTLTPTIYFTQTVSQIQTSAGFWMKLKDLTGKIETGAFSVPLTFLGTGLNTINNSDFEVYPNPVLTQLTVKFKDNVYKDYMIYDLRGTLLEKKHIKNGVDDIKINFENIEKGIYFLKLNSEKSSCTVKILK